MVPCTTDHFVWKVSTQSAVILLVGWILFNKLEQFTWILELKACILVIIKSNIKQIQLLFQIFYFQLIHKRVFNFHVGFQFLPATVRQWTYITCHSEFNMFSFNMFENIPFQFLCIVTFGTLPEPLPHGVLNFDHFGQYDSINF